MGMGWGIKLEMRGKKANITLFLKKMRINYK